MRLLLIYCVLLFSIVAGTSPVSAQESAPAKRQGKEVVAQGAVVDDEAESSTPPVRIVGRLIDFTAANPGSGANPGQWGNTAQLQIGADLDGERLLGWTGASLRVRESFFVLRRNAVLDPGVSPPATNSGHFWAQDAGSTLGGVPFPNFIPDSYLSELTLTQNIGARFEVQAGRMNPMMYFDSPTNCETSLSCQNPISLYDNLTLPPAFATWGARIGLDLSSRDSVQAGVFQDYFSLNRTTGFDWSFKGGSGVFIAGEYTHTETAADSRYPLSYTLGVWHDTSQFSDPATAVAQRGSTSAYGRVQQVVWRSPEANTHLTGFATAGHSFSSAQPYRTYVEGGVNLHGLFQTRPDDFVGFKLAWLNIRRNQLIAERTLRRQLSGDDRATASHQFRLEANAHISVYRGVVFEPSIQYIVNPNTQFSDTLSAFRVPKDGFILGSVLIIDLPKLLGI